jgi:pimeloyl-ACP methyl ester carboxylesterase
MSRLLLISGFSNIFLFLDKKSWVNFAILLITFIILIIAMQFLIKKMIYPAPVYQVDSPPPADLREVILDTPEDDKIYAWYRQADSGAPVILFFHGNGENLQTLWLSGLLQELDKLNINYLALDYPGYGRSGGTPSESSLIASGEAAVLWLKKYHHQSPLVLCGWSLGASVATLVAATKPELISGLVLLSPWESLPAIAKDHYPDWMVNRLLREEYNSMAAAKKIQIPVLICHGSKDKTIPVSHAQNLAKEFPYVAKFLEIPTASHNDLLAYPEVWKTIGLYLEVVQKSSQDIPPQ